MNDPEFPPKNRLPHELPILRIEIEHADGVEIYSPNSIIMALVNRTKSLANRLTGWRPVTSQASCLSQKPAFLYRASDLEIPLSSEEILRYVAHDLTPAEYFALRNRYGYHFEIHDDFYADDTGEALQPVGKR